ncbi:MAG: methyltransferase domain-containing protein [Thermoplasmata archaeon]
MLEIGSGYGRMTPELLGHDGEVVVSDYDVGALESMELPPIHPPPALRIALNLYHLPFRDGTFTAATLIRVYHHLDRPRAALSELARVLRPSSRLLVSYNPRPTLGTLALDVRRALQSDPSSPVEWVTFSRREPVSLPPDPFPVYVGRRRGFLEDVGATGFTLEREFVSGLEEFSVLRRHLPIRWFVAWARAFGTIPAMPMRWAVLTRLGSAGRVPPVYGTSVRDCLACPRCRAPLTFDAAGDSVVCTGCAFVGVRRGEVLDLRYRAPDLSTFGPRPEDRVGAGNPVRTATAPAHADLRKPDGWLASPPGRPPAR